MQPQATGPVPAWAWALSGVGWRAGHEAALAAAAQPPGFIEVHSENFFAEGGAALGSLLAARRDHAVSLHGVGLGLGSAAGLDADHLDRLARLVQQVQPARVSDHAAFARAPRQPGGPVLHANDLLPLAFTEASLRRLVAQVQQVQDRLRRPLLVENLSAYLRWARPEMDEVAFFNRLVRHSGCGLLLDVNNLVVNARNDLAAAAGSASASASMSAALAGGSASAASCSEPGQPPAPGQARRRSGLRREPPVDPLTDPAVLARVARFIDRLDPGVVQQVHLAGHGLVAGLAIDDHGSAVPPLVWQAYGHLLQRTGPVPTLVEWDQQLPAFEVLLAQAAEAARQLAACGLPPAAAKSVWPLPLPAGSAWPPVPPMSTAPGPGASNAPEPAEAGSAPARAAESQAVQAALAADVADAAEAARQQALVAALWQPVVAQRSPQAGGGATAACATATAPDGQHPEAQPDDAGQAGSRERLDKPDNPPHAALQALLPWLDTTALSPARGLQAYRGHARALAPRALGQVYPVVAALVGDEAWAALARRHWLAHPPTQGDLAAWGDALPQALADDPRLADWPWLADVARLEALVHRAGRAPDVSPGVAQLERLATADPATCGLRCAPGAALLVSAWPVVALWQAHTVAAGAPRPPARPAASAPPAAPDLRAARALLAAGAGQTAWVWRAGGLVQAQAQAHAQLHAEAQVQVQAQVAVQVQVQVQALRAGDAACLQALLHGAALGTAMDAAEAAEPGWSVEAWLHQALAQGWLSEVQADRAAG